MRDLLVVLPGIMGSTLVRDRRVLWDASLAVAGRHALTRLRDLDLLTLPPGLGDGDPQDGVRPERLLNGLHLLPGVSAIDGYTALLRSLTARLDVTSGPGGNLLPFPYDWRLSVRHNAHRLGERIRPALAAWRERSGNPGARVAYVAHSMGGLVARYHLDILGGAADARLLATIGTPFRGSVNALTTLHAGVAPRLGPLSAPFTRLARTLPALHQLLPDWRCVVRPDGTRVGLDDLDGRALTGPDPALVADALALHAELAAASPAPSYRLHIFGGLRQPTHQTVALGTGALVARRELDGEDHHGDGTVPRFSCFPHQLADDADVRYFAQRHGSLQNEPALLHQLEAVLTAREPRAFLAGDHLELSVDAPEYADGLAVPLEVRALRNGPTLAATAQDAESGMTTAALPLRSHRDGRWTATFSLPQPGTWRIKVHDALTPTRVQSVTAVVLAGPGDNP